MATAEGDMKPMKARGEAGHLNLHESRMACSSAVHVRFDTPETDFERAGSSGAAERIEMLIRTACLALALICASAAAQAQNNGANTAAGAIIGGTAGALIGGAITGTGGGAAAGAIIGGTTGAIIGSQQPGRGGAYYFWANDGRCYLHHSNGSIQRVSRGYCR